MKKKGQFVLVSIIAFVITLIIFIGVYPALSTVIDNFTSSTSDPVMSFLIKLVPFVVIFAMFMGLFYSMQLARPGG